MTEKAKAQDIASLNAFASNILFASSAAGVPVTAATTSSSGSYTITSSLSVADTAITGGTISINVKTEADGSLTALKNGQVWKSFAAESLTGVDVKLGAGDITLQLLGVKQGKTTQLV